MVSNYNNSSYNNQRLVYLVVTSLKNCKYPKSIPQTLLKLL